MGNSKNRPQVFINFRGKDERQKLLPHLKHHLKDRNTNVFTDDDAVGEPLKNLFKHIRRSRIVIVIFSINYLESEWCLDELVEIRKCLETEKIDFAIPIFYKVDFPRQATERKLWKKVRSLTEKAPQFQDQEMEESVAIRS
ncbi:protein PHLOEM PROTEIN 2-LIKE A8-like [Raphanus sativus]|uniref:Protein PHLOEM PROTEIN 2-LIKE A8-like n=1 Tax=Raphanus sativus TaxID=3726 RepID=A0A9W3DG80_RAPSA|nr:protein PHLOEM PROTEIN 2-LIKE A8-like [Raphanus sativus]